jgi:ribokinase
MRVFPGGKGLNQSIALARSGSDVSHAGMVGADGEHLIRHLKDAGVNTDLISISDKPTGHTVIQVTPEGENSIMLYPGANREPDKAFVDRALAAFGAGDVLVLQNEVSCIAYAIGMSKARGMKAVFNPSPFSPEIFDYPLELVDIWLLNEIEGALLTGKESPAAMLETMGAMFPKSIAVITLGKDGVICRSPCGVYSHGCYSVDVRDTTAAGDTFTGYFISSITAGKGMAEALSLASAAAAISVSRQGASVSIPFLHEVYNLK